MAVTGMPEVVGDRVQTCPRCGDTYSQLLCSDFDEENTWADNWLTGVRCGYCHAIYPVCIKCGIVCLGGKCPLCSEKDINADEDIAKEGV